MRPKQQSLSVAFSATMSSDVHLAGRATTPGGVKRKLSYDAGEFDGYYGAWDDGHQWEEKWDDGHQQWDSGGMAYYHGYPEYESLLRRAAGVWDSVEIDLYSMVFSLDDALEPQDLYTAFELDEKSLAFALEIDDIQESVPAAWRSRPLKIHPEPPPKHERKESKAVGASAAVVVAASAVAAAASNTDTEAVAMTPTPGSASVGSPRAGSTGQGSGGLAPLSSPAKHKSTPDTTGLLVRLESETGLESSLLTPQSLQRSPGTTASERGSQGTVTSVGSQAQPGPQSPKIVISNSQLEHLKQKMQALKQKRSMGPIAITHASDNERPSQEDPVEDTPPQRASGQPVVHSNCPGMHGLSLFRTPDPGWWCSVCKREHPRGSSFYGCRDCDYDECERCALTPLSQRGEGAARVPKAAAQPQSPGESSASPKAPAKASPASAPPVASPSSASPSPPRREQPLKKKRRSKRVARESATKSVQEPPPNVQSRRASGSSKAMAQVARRAPSVSEDQRSASPPERASASEAPSSPGEARRSDDELSSAESASMVARGDPRLIPRERRPDAPDRWKPGERKVAKAVMEGSESPLREARRNRDGVGGEAPKAETTVKRRSIKERLALSRSRDRSSSAHPELGRKKKKKKKRKYTKRSTSPEPPRRASPSGGTVSLTGASVAAVRRSPELPSRSREPARPVRRPAEAAPRQRPSGGGNDFLRRVLRAAGQQAPKRPSQASNMSSDRAGVLKDSEPRATLLPPSFKEPPSESLDGARGAGGLVATLKPSASRDGTLRSAAGLGIRKAIEDTTSDRKSRRV